MDLISPLKFNRVSRVPELVIFNFHSSTEEKHPTANCSSSTKQNCAYLFGMEFVNLISIRELIVVWWQRLGDLSSLFQDIQALSFKDTK